MAKYFYSIEGKTLGPVGPKGIMDLILGDELNQDSSVMDTRSPRWIKIREIPELMRYLHESNVRISDWDEEKALAGIEDEKAPLFFHIPLKKLLLLSVLTLGAYELYWLYMNWRFLRYHRTRRTSTNFWRDVINPFAVAGIFYQVSMDSELGGRSADRDFTANGWIWYVCMVAQGVVGSGALYYSRTISIILNVSMILAVLGISIWCIIPVQRHINAANVKLGREYTQLFFGHYAMIGLGILGWVFLLLTLIFAVNMFSDVRLMGLLGN
jgi:hypothetical protein